MTENEIEMGRDFLAIAKGTGEGNAYYKVVAAVERAREQYERVEGQPADADNEFLMIEVFEEATQKLRQTLTDEEKEEVFARGIECFFRMGRDFGIVE